VIGEWVEYRLRRGEGQPETVRAQAACLRIFLHDYCKQDLEVMTPKRADHLYQQAIETPTKKTGRPLSVASHHFYLGLGKSFYAWTVERGYVGANPFAKVTPVGKQNTGKSQLRLDEARKFLDVAFTYYEEKRNPLAIGAAVALLMGLRTSEVLHREVRDLEDGGRYLCIDRGKTFNAARRPEIPDRLRPFLLDLAQGKRPEELLFGMSRGGKPRCRQRLHAMVRRLCKLASVPIVCTHSLRGLFATLGVQSGAVTHAVAATLGHGTFAVTQRHYAQPDAVANVQTARVAALLSTEPSGASLTGLSAEQILARLDPSTLTQLAALLSAQGGEHKLH
jgi:integrase